MQASLRIAREADPRAVDVKAGVGGLVATADPERPGCDVEEVVDLLGTAARRLPAGVAVSARRVEHHDVAVLGEEGRVAGVVGVRLVGAPAMAELDRGNAPR